MIREAIVKLVNKENLTYEMAEGAMDEIMGGKADPIQISAFLTAMTMKGETIEEITACANGMRKHGVHMEHDKDVLEIVGTGGDKSNSFNISTTASLVISAGGVAVAKHGNRAASSESGAAGLSRSARRQNRPGAGEKQRSSGKTWNLFPVRTEIPHVHEIRGTGPQAARHPDHFQHPRTADQPGSSHDAGDGGLRGSTCPPDGRSSLQSWCQTRHGCLRPGLPR